MAPEIKTGLGIAGAGGELQPLGDREAALAEHRVLAIVRGQIVDVGVHVRTEQARPRRIQTVHVDVTEPKDGLEQRRLHRVHDFLGAALAVQ
jgi:hypothetical protein